MPCQRMIVVGKLSTFSNHAIYNIFNLRYYKLLSLLGAVIQIFTRSSLDSVFSKVFSETEEKKWNVKMSFCKLFV